MQEEKEEEEEAILWMEGQEQRQHLVSLIW